MDQPTAAAIAHPAKDHHKQLTAREELVVAWIAMGLGRKEIAALLHRKLKNVESHLVYIHLKLGFHDPARLTHYALACKLVKLNETV